jgi:hypothetical protein
MQPLPIEEILSQFNEDDEAWVLQDLVSKKYVVIPDDRFHGKHPIRFFMRRSDAADLLAEVQAVNEKLRFEVIGEVSVKLLTAMRTIALTTNPYNADSFAVHTPQEVFEYLR